MSQRICTISSVTFPDGSSAANAMLTEDGIKAIAPLLVQLFAAALAAGTESQKGSTP